MFPPNSGRQGAWSAPKVASQLNEKQFKPVFKTSFDGHSGLFQTTLISQFLTSLLPKLTLILTKSLTSDPYNRGFLFRRKSVPDHGDAEVVENVPLAERRGDTTVIIRSNVNAGHNVVSLYAAAMYCHLLNLIFLILFSNLWHLTKTCVFRAAFKVGDGALNLAAPSSYITA